MSASIVTRYEDEFTIAQNAANELAIKCFIARNDIDPEIISRQDMDRIMRLHTAISIGSENANNAITKIQDEAAIELTKLKDKIFEALERYKTIPKENEI